MALNLNISLAEKLLLRNYIRIGFAFNWNWMQIEITFKFKTYKTKFKLASFISLVFLLLLSTLFLNQRRIPRLLFSQKESLKSKSTVFDYYNNKMEIKDNFQLFYLTKGRFNARAIEFFSKFVNLEEIPLRKLCEGRNRLKSTGSRRRNRRPRVR